MSTVSLLPSAATIFMKRGRQKSHFFLAANTRLRLFTSAVVVPPNNEYLPIDFDSSSHILGEESQIVTISLLPNQMIRAESGAMLYMTEGVQMNTTMGGDVSSGLTRILTGQNLFLSDYSYTGTTGRGEVALGTDFPSKILRLSVDDGPLICQKGAFLCAPHTVNIEMEFTKNMTTGFFGGEGFILQKLTGTGDVFVKAGGMLVRRVLKANETLRISSGSLVAFTQGIEYDVQMVPGFKNVVFGGEGLFFTTLTGPGTVWLQSNPPDRMISEIARRIPSRSGIGIGIPILGGGGGGAEEAAAETVAGTDAAVEADRQATVASSGLGGGEEDFTSNSSEHTSSFDPDSPSALFGDAAPPADADSTSFSQNDKLFENSDPSSFPEDSTTFSSENNNNAAPKDFDDPTTFEDGSVDFGEDSVNQAAETAKGILSQIWDFFNRDD